MFSKVYRAKKLLKMQPRLHRCNKSQTNYRAKILLIAWSMSCLSKVPSCYLKLATKAHPRKKEPLKRWRNLVKTLWKRALRAKTIPRPIILSINAVRDSRNLDRNSRRISKISASFERKRVTVRCRWWTNWRVAKIRYSNAQPVARSSQRCVTSWTISVHTRGYAPSLALTVTSVLPSEVIAIVIKTSVFASRQSDY